MGSALDIYNKTIKEREAPVRTREVEEVEDRGEELIIKDPKIIATLDAMGILDEYQESLYEIKHSKNVNVIRVAQSKLKAYKDIVDFNKSVADVSKKTEDNGGDSIDEIKVTMIYEVDKKDFE